MVRFCNPTLTGGDCKLLVGLGDIPPTTDVGRRDRIDEVLVHGGPLRRHHPHTSLERGLLVLQHSQLRTNPTMMSSPNEKEWILCVTFSVGTPP